MLKIYALRQETPYPVIQVELYDKYFPKEDEKEHPIYEINPSIVLVAHLSDFNEHCVRLECGCKQSVIPNQLALEVHDFMDFIQNKHWRNMIAIQNDRYGSLFDADNDC